MHCLGDRSTFSPIFQVVRLCLVVLIAFVAGCGSTTAPSSDSSEAPVAAESGGLGSLFGASTEDAEGTTAPSSLKTGDVSTNSIGMKLGVLPPGEFEMGSPETEEKRSGDESRHRVRLTKPAFMTTYEITQAEFLAVMETSPSGITDSDRLPVQNVSWEQAVAFCRKLSELPEEKAAGRIYQLPTESQWEYACRAGSTTPTSFGGAITSSQANFDGNYPYGTDTSGTFVGKPQAVGSYEPNAWGFYDMHGNVWEWCRDWYAADYYTSAAADDPEGPATGISHVIRGGSWYNFGVRFDIRDDALSAGFNVNKVGPTVECTAGTPVTFCSHCHGPSHSVSDRFAGVIVACRSRPTQSAKALRHSATPADLPGFRTSEWITADGDSRRRGHGSRWKTDLWITQQFDAESGCSPTGRSQPAGSDLFRVYCHGLSAQRVWMAVDKSIGGDGHCHTRRHGDRAGAYWAALEEPNSWSKSRTCLAGAARKSSTNRRGACPVGVCVRESGTAGRNSCWLRNRHKLVVVFPGPAVVQLLPRQGSRTVPHDHCHVWTWRNAGTGSPALAADDSRRKCRNNVNECRGIPAAWCIGCRAGWNGNRHLDLAQDQIRIGCDFAVHAHTAVHFRVQ